MRPIMRRPTKPPSRRSPANRPSFESGAHRGGPGGGGGPHRARPQRPAEGAGPRDPDRSGGGGPRHRGAATPPPAPDRPDAPRPGAGAGSGAYWLYGLHAVAAALSNPARRPRRLLVTEDAQAALAPRVPRPWRLQPERADRSRFATFLPEDAVHQGAALLVEPLEPADLEDTLAASDGPVLVLDQVTDPRNVGAILRSAAALGAACVVLQDRNAPAETGALARVASGALELVPVVRVVNLARAIQQMQRAGLWVMGLAGDAPRTLAEARPTDRRVALVLGAEDTGLRRLQRESCDELVRLPISPRMESLNVAAAAAVALYEVARDAAAPAEGDDDGEGFEGGDEA